MIQGKTTTVLASRLARRKVPSTATSLFAKRPSNTMMVPAANRSSLPMASHSPALGFRHLSTEIRAQTAAAAAANASMAAEASGTGTKKKAESNVFLDNLGKIFLLGIGSVIVTLVRSSYNTSNRHLIRDRLEEIAAMDPKEIEEFREANSELTLDVMRQILHFYYTEETKSIDASGVTTSYEEFVTAIRKIMATKFPKEGESFTIQTGHYLDRIVVAALEERGEGAPHVTKLAQNSNDLPVALLFAAMAMAMNGSVSDRIRILHEILVMEEETQKQQQEQMGMMVDGRKNSGADSVPLARVRAMVGYLQETCQLPPDTQIVPTDRKYPTQLWRRATPMDMVPDILQDEKETQSENIDLVEFAAILRTKSVCAWGECYMKWMPDASEFEAPQTQTSEGSLTR